MAVKHAKLAAVKLLVETYASSDGVNYYHSLALLNATKVNDVEMVKLVITKASKPDIQSAMLEAAENGLFEIVAALSDSYHADDAFSALKALVTLVCTLRTIRETLVY
ncbi:hypothetical protein JG688_00017741 [Phytophthora aleatoria]|uniref:Uncharacterized protein n=1 Tax=Phytophthora aleatoria TaxID=2496075 RepID=A0A8J5IDA4_9STRA|nr:hypothetical protein JG688_00017741 [Phytophthora aleatoria]